MSRRSIFTTCILACILTLALAGCGGSSQPTSSPAQQQNPPVQGETAAPAQPAEPTAVPATPTAETQRGPGSFDLSDPATGLGDLPGYQAVLRMVFDGTRDGQSYHAEKAFSVLHSAADSARLMVDSTVRADGTVEERFSGTLGQVRYSKPAPDLACAAGMIDLQTAPFDPARQLPRLAGAEPAGQETVDGITADVYAFDQRAIGAGEAATASGKVWIAQPGGYVVKYELAMQSETVFGPGITGEQRWEYTLNQQPPALAEVLPADCPLPLAGVPTLDGATNVISLPGEIRYQTASAKDAIAAFYAEQFKAQGYLPQGEAVETGGGTRWIFGKQEEGKAVVMLLTVKPADSGVEVRVTQIITDPPPAQGQ